MIGLGAAINTINTTRIRQLAAIGALNSNSTAFYPASVRFTQSLSGVCEVFALKSLPEFVV